MENYEKIHINYFGDIEAKNEDDYIKLAQQDINKIKYFPSEKFSDSFTIKLYDVLADYIVKKLSCFCHQKLTRSELESLRQKLTKILRRSEKL